MIGSCAKLRPAQWYVGQINSAAKDEREKSGECLINYFGDDWLSEIMPKEEMEHRSLVEFEGLDFYTFSNPELHLRQWYGPDWRTPYQDANRFHGVAWLREKQGD